MKKFDGRYYTSEERKKWAETLTIEEINEILSTGEHDEIEDIVNFYHSEDYCDYCAVKREKAHRERIADSIKPGSLTMVTNYAYKNISATELKAGMEAKYKCKPGMDSYYYVVFTDAGLSKDGTKVTAFYRKTNTNNGVGVAVYRPTDRIDVYENLNID